MTRVCRLGQLGKRLDRGSAELVARNERQVFPGVCECSLRVLDLLEMRGRPALADHHAAGLRAQALGGRRLCGRHGKEVYCEPEQLRQRYLDACDRSRAVVRAASGLEQMSVKPVRGKHFSLRWVLLHLIEETARHAGHADLLREAIDGSVG